MAKLCHLLCIKISKNATTRCDFQARSLQRSPYSIAALGLQGRGRQGIEGKGRGEKGEGREGGRRRGRKRTPLQIWLQAWYRSWLEIWEISALLMTVYVGRTQMLDVLTASVVAWPSEGWLATKKSLHAPFLELPSVREPSGLVRDDGKRLDGSTAGSVVIYLPWSGAEAELLTNFEHFNDNYVTILCNP